MSLRRIVAYALAASLGACSSRSVLPPNAAIGSDEGVAIPASAVDGVPETSLGSVQFVVTLPLRNAQRLARFLADLQNSASPSYRKFLSNAEFVREFAPPLARRVAVARDLQAAGFRVAIADQAVIAGGTPQAVQRYFRTTLQTRRYGSAAVAVAQTPLRLSPLLARSGAAIVGLDGLPPLRTFSAFAPPHGSLRPQNESSPYGPYYTADLKQAYQYPSYVLANGTGQTIAIVIDSPIAKADMRAYFGAEGLPVPSIVTKKIQGGGTFGGSDTGEATLDVQQSGGMAPKASVIVYDIANLYFSSIYAGYAAVVKNDAVTVVNSSFGGCETYLNGSASGWLTRFDNLFREGSAEGITWVAASGDRASRLCGAGASERGVSWPADDPYVVAVGGTNLTTAHKANDPNSSYVHEDAYQEPLGGGAYWGSGGGYSTIYPVPPWQRGFITHAGRGIPDVSVHMGGEGFSSHGAYCQALKCNKDDSSDVTIEQGNTYSTIGTSAASPDFAGLIALTAELAGTKLGDVHAEIYRLAKKRRDVYFRPGIKGDNGFKTTNGLWDPVLGLGTPYGYHFAGAKQPAGEPGTASNP